MLRYSSSSYVIVIGVSFAMFCLLFPGMPYVRPMPKLSAVAGKPFHLKCPVAGYPIDSVIIEKGKLVNWRHILISRSVILSELSSFYLCPLSLINRLYPELNFCYSNLSSIIIMNKFKLSLIIQSSFCLIPFFPIILFYP